VAVVPVAEIVPDVFVLTALVATLNVIDVLPEGTVAVGGTLATLGIELARETLKLAGATALRVRNACKLLPPMAEPGTVSQEISIGLSVSVALAVDPE
jgi:hypothetical protein